MIRMPSAMILAVGLVATSACSHMPASESFDRCPPRATIAGASGPRLASGGTGVAPREVLPTVDEGVLGGGTTTTLASGGTGVPERVVTPSPSRVPAPATPHLVAGGRGIPPRVECE
jgi:hypothetical protein